jgi:hypothetical protein
MKYPYSYVFKLWDLRFLKNCILNMFNMFEKARREYART